jgi:hypothetical protein
MSFITSKHLTRVVVGILFIVILVCTYLAYQPGLYGAFVFDDAPNILKNGEIAVQEFNFPAIKKIVASGSSGPLGRPLSMLSFAANYYNTGANPYYFKLTNLFIHLGNGLGIFVLSFLLLDAYRKRFQQTLSDFHIQLVSLAIAAAWLMHPFNLTSVLYVVQRMTSLSAFFAIWGLALFTWGRTRLLEGKSGIFPILISLFVFTPLSVFSKETGALIPVFMLVIEISLFHLHTGNRPSRRFLLAFFAITFVLPAIFTIGYITTHPSWLLAGYRFRSFTLAERVMTEARVIWFYLHMIVLPNNIDMGLFHDDIANSKGLLTPITTLPAIVGIFGLFVLSWISRKKAPLVTFGTLIFLAGHALESSIFSLEISFEHRNYLPMFGILLPLFFYLLQPLQHLQTLRIRQLVAMLLIGLFAYDTWGRAGTWSNPVDLAKSEVEHHPLSARNNGEMGNNYASIRVQNADVANTYYLQARHYYEQSTIVDPDYTLGLFGLIITSSEKNKPIDAQWITELAHRLQFSPAEVGLGDKLILLVNCQIQQTCKLDKQDMEKLIHAALQNTTVTGPLRALVLSGYSTYLVDVAVDYPAAIKVMYETIDTVPQDLGYRLTLVEFLAALRKTDEARQQLAIVKRMDSGNAYRDKILTDEKLLAENGKT